VWVKKRYGKGGESIKDLMARDNDIFKKQTGSSVPFHAHTDDMRGLIWHEFAHAMDNVEGYVPSQTLAKMYDNGSPAFKANLRSVSSYGASDILTGKVGRRCAETWAECVAATITNTAQAKFVPDEVKRMIWARINKE